MYKEKTLPPREPQKVSERAPMMETAYRAPTVRRRSIPATVPTGLGIGPAYERFLELPVAVVLLVMWVVGLALIGACALMVYAGVVAAGRVVGAF